MKHLENPTKTRTLIKLSCQQLTLRHLRNLTIIMLPYVLSSVDVKSF